MIFISEKQIIASGAGLLSSVFKISLFLTAGSSISDLTGRTRAN
jgi:hypothetical protein